MNIVFAFGTLFNFHRTVTSLFFLIEHFSCQIIIHTEKIIFLMRHNRRKSLTILVIKVIGLLNFRSRTNLFQSMKAKACYQRISNLLWSVANVYKFSNIPENCNEYFFAHLWKFNFSSGEFSNIFEITL